MLIQSVRLAHEGVTAVAKVRLSGGRLLAVVVLAVVCLAASPNSSHASMMAQENHPALVWSGGWNTTVDAASAGGARRSSTTAGAAVTVAFNGTSFAWVGRRRPTAGSAAVSLDGVPKGVVDLAALGPAADQMNIWGVAGLKRGYHYVSIRALRSTDASGFGAIDVDAFATDGTITNVLRKSPFKYPWKTYIVIDKSEYRLYWVKNGWLIKTYKIAHGRKKGWTPNRVWKIGRKYKSAPRGVYGPRKMRLYRQVKTRRGVRYVYTRYLIHGTNQPWVIGTMASHGCIRMYNRDVLELWPQVPVGTMVVTRN